MGNPTPPGSGLQNLIEEVKQLRAQVRDLSRPGGTQRANALGGLTGVQGKLVAFGSIGKSTTNFVVPTVYTDVSGDVIPIPEGYTQAAILGIVSVGAWNGSAAGGYLYTRCMINGTPGASLPVFAGPSAYGTVPASAIRTLKGLTPGESIAVSAQCQAAGSWGANASNIANIDVIALFSR